MAKEKKYGLLNPKGASTGLLDNFKGTIVSARYVNGKDTTRAKTFDPPVVGALIVYELEDGSTHEDYVIAANTVTRQGDPLWEVSDDGLTLIPLMSADTQSLWVGSELIQYMGALGKAGFPESQMSDEIDAIEGVSAVWVRTDLEGRKKNEKGYMPQILMAKEGTLELAGKGGAKKAGASAGTRGGARRPAADDDDSKEAQGRAKSARGRAAKEEPAVDAEQAAIEYIKGALEAADGKATLKDLADAVFSAALADKHPKALANAINDIVEDADQLDELGAKNGWTVNARRGTVLLD